MRVTQVICDVCKAPVGEHSYAVRYVRREREVGRTEPVDVCSTCFVDRPVKVRDAVQAKQRTTWVGDE